MPKNNATENNIFHVPSTDRARAIATIVLAFAADPMARSSWTDAKVYLSAMPRLADAFAGQAYDLGTAYGIGDYAGAALWLPPGVAPDEAAMERLMRETLTEEQLESSGNVFEQMAAFHPKEPHWYLPLIGVDPACQGRGHGDALMAHALARCDADGVPAYLESSNPKNVSLYRRHGFEQIGTIPVRDSLALIPMLRKARR